MLADYPVVVDYNFSPVQSPVFHRDVGPADEFFTPVYCEGDDIELPLVDHERLSDDHPLSLIEDNDISSLTPTIQYSETLDIDDHDTQRGINIINSDGHDRAGEGESTCSCPGNHSQDCSISDRGEDVGTDVEGLFGSVGSDYLSSSYLSALQDACTSLPENVSLDELNPAELELCLGSSVEVEDCNSNRSKVTEKKTSPPSSSPTHSKGTRRKKKTEDKRWSEMNAAEKEEVAEHLSSVLQSLLGPRERVEVMAMISHHKISRLSDRNFVIESHMLNEATLAKLETFLEKHEMTGEASDSEVISEPERKRSCGNVGRRKCASLPASPQHAGSFSESAPSIGGKKRSSQRKSLRSWRRRTRKEYRQASKERRSGLFNQEEVISLTRNIEEDDDEEEEIDILD